MRSYLWLLPFCSFFIGYYAANRYWRIPSLPTPSLIGLTLAQAVPLLSQANLYPKLLEEKIDVDLPAGTIISQIPAAKTTIKPGQSVALIITKQPPAFQAPHYLGLKKPTIEHDTHASGMRIKSYQLISAYPADTCIGQWPSPDTVLEEKTMIVYYASAKEQPVIVPDLCGKSLSTVYEFCLKHSLPEPVLYTSDSTKLHNQDIIIDQRPIPGSIVMPSALCFYLQVNNQ